MVPSVPAYLACTDIKAHTAIQRGTSDVIILHPPLEVALADKKLEYEPNRKPGRIVDTRRWRNEGYTD